MSDEKIKELETRLDTLTAAYNDLYEIIATSFAALASVAVKGGMISSVRPSDSSTNVPETTEEG